MKKILFLLVMVLGLLPFKVAADATIKNSTYEKSINCEPISQNYIVDITYEKSNKFLDIVVLSCTATVYYNGEVVESFTVIAIDESFLDMACQLANALALEYIEQQEEEQEQEEP